MPADSQRMLQLAQSVADGEPVDWLKAEKEASDPEEVSIVRRLKSLSALAGVHRSPQSTTHSLRASDFFIPVAKKPSEMQRWGGLEILKKLGEGAFAEVFLARDPKLEREVALKLLRERSGKTGIYEAMLQEARLFARIRNPNVATVYGAEVFEGRPGFWMERIRGKSLDQLLDERGAFGAREAAGVGVEICKALAAVHGAGLVHRDVKAANVMREEGGRIVLMDFGAGRNQGLESAGNMAGTPLYMAPELFQKKPATPQTDLYALGVMLYHLATKQYPVEAEDLKGLVDAHERKEARLLRDRRADLPEAFVRVVERALAHEPAARFRSAGEMERALVESLGASTVKIEEVPARSSRGLWIGLGAAAAVAVAAAMFWPRAVNEPALSTARSSVLAAPEEKTPQEPPKQDPKPALEPELRNEPKSEAVAPPSRPELQLGAKLFLVDGEKKAAIPSGKRVQPGDRLAIEVDCPERVFLYAFAFDVEGAAYPLFPLPETKDEFPVSAGKGVRIPGALLQVMGEGRSEKILLVASRDPNPPLQAEAKEKMRHKRRRTLEREPLSDEARERRLRDRKGAEPAFPKESSILKLAEAAKSLPEGGGSLGDFWVQVFEIEVPR